MLTNSEHEFELEMKKRNDEADALNKKMLERQAREENQARKEHEEIEKRLALYWASPAGIEQARQDRLSLKQAARPWNRFKQYLKNLKHIVFAFFKSKQVPTTAFSPPSSHTISLKSKHLPATKKLDVKTAEQFLFDNLRKKML